jgi:predicted homoserine dehydrogenase-like protein
MALIGCGDRGTGVLGEFLAVDGVQVTAVCDLVREHALQRGQRT